ncbi:unnamed protein product [Amoebophrya sp. A25]|nr:unnamed protein product [Amoebophrya sp. A25]|eukprot:GSA25T00016821001.1
MMTSKRPPSSTMPLQSNTDQNSPPTISTEHGSSTSGSVAPVGRSSNSKTGRTLPSPQVAAAQAKNFDTLAKIFGENDLPMPREDLLESPGHAEMHAEILGTPKSRSSRSFRPEDRSTSSPTGRGSLVLVEKSSSPSGGGATSSGATSSSLNHPGGGDIKDQVLEHVEKYKSENYKSAPADLSPGTTSRADEDEDTCSMSEQESPGGAFSRDWITLEAEVCRNFDSARLGAKLFLLLLLRKLRDFSKKKIRYRELEHATTLLYRALDEESQILASMYNTMAGTGGGPPAAASSKIKPSGRQHEIAVILFAISNLQQHALEWKETIMEAYSNQHGRRQLSFRALASFLDESIAVLEALYWKKKALLG